MRTQQATAAANACVCVDGISSSWLKQFPAVLFNVVVVPLLLLLFFHSLVPSLLLLLLLLFWIAIALWRRQPFHLHFPPLAAILLFLLLIRRHVGDRSGN